MRGTLGRCATATAIAGCLTLAGCTGASSSGGPSVTPTPGPSTPASASTFVSPTPATSKSVAASHSASPSQSKSAAPATAPAVTVNGTFAKNLDVPWGIAVLSDGSALVSLRDSGRVVHVSTTGRVTTVGQFDVVHSSAGENGLLGLAVRPKDDSVVWAYESTSSGNRVLRMSYANGRLGPAKTILSGIPTGVHHNGGRMVFGPDGDLYISTGEAEVPSRAQDRGSLGGKILRIKGDGSIPADNPFHSAVWSYGHRNIEGLAFDSAGRLWSTELGDHSWDELNLIVKGHNYGWPVVEGKTPHAGFTEPQVQWRTDEASPSGLAIVDDVAYVGALKGQRLWQVPLYGGKAGEPRAYFVGRYGRLRTVVAAPGGGLWVTTSNTDGRSTPKRDDDRILRLRLG